MDCAPWQTWLAVASNVILWTLIGWWVAAHRRLRRIAREIEADRARVTENLARSEQLLRDLDHYAPWIGFIDEPEPPVH